MYKNYVLLLIYFWLAHSVEIMHKPVLKPDLNDPHVQTGVLSQLLPHVPGRLRRSLVRLLQNLHLLKMN